MSDNFDYTKGAIVTFKHDYRFLSNFYSCIIYDENRIMYPSVEHYYQAMKSYDINIHRRVASILYPKDAKLFGKRIEEDKLDFRQDWHEVKLKIMTKGLLQKFDNDSNLAKKLIDTNGYLLIEGNYWGDSYWGVDLKTGIGENKLGILLMRIRENLLKKNP